MDRVLVVGATGHVGSQVVKGLLRRGYPVRAFVRRAEDRVHGASGDLDYAIGDLNDRTSIRAALRDVGIVVSSANAVVPKGRTKGAMHLADHGYVALIEEAEAAGVRQFVQSSVPSHPMEAQVPELASKRRIEALLEQSDMATTVIRNPAFTDVWLVMGGAIEAAAKDPHATTARPYGFQKTWQRMTGRFVSRFGILLAPGGANHGAPFVASRDVAEMMAGAVGRQDMFNSTVEAGGPEWLTWRQVAGLLSEKTGKRVRVLGVPAGMARALQLVVRPFAPSASDVMALLRFVGSFQPQWHAPEIVQQLDLPPQTTMREYLDEHWRAD